jgi:hypothetical protein
LLLPETIACCDAQHYVHCRNASAATGAGPVSQPAASLIHASPGAGSMIIVFTLLFVAFLVGIWMGLCFYRRSSVKATADTAIVPRYTESRTRRY